MRTQLVSVAALLLSASVHAVPPPCGAPEHRQFDFWVGEWQVRKPDGAVAGVNRITSEYGGCVIHERYDTGKGYTGESLNVYDASRKVWHQTWVDNSGLLLTLEGRWDGKSMILEGQAPRQDGSMAKQRITWTPSADGGLRQLWETAGSDGSWTVAFDGRYTKR